MTDTVESIVAVNSTVRVNTLGRMDLATRDSLCRACDRVKAVGNLRRQTGISTLGHTRTIKKMDMDVMCGLMGVPTREDLPVT